MLTAGVSYGGSPPSGCVTARTQKCRQKYSLKTDLDHTGGFVVKAYGVNELRKCSLEFFESKGTSGNEELSIGSAQ